MKIGCLMPTFNRVPGSLWLLQEAVESFVRQSVPSAGRVLILCNDTPGVRLVCDAEGVVVHNVPQRFPTLSDKIQWMVDEHPECRLFCRWDDDDISLPHRLDYSLARLSALPNGLEWRATNYWYAPVNQPLAQVNIPGNTHVMALWDRDALRFFPDGKYPQKASGWEDQQFNRLLAQAGIGHAQQIPPQDIFYLYRWGVSPCHLSGRGGGTTAGLQAHYDDLGTRPVEIGTYHIEPTWYKDYPALALEAACGHSVACSVVRTTPAV